jgi:hypothetical protein
LEIRIKRYNPADRVVHVSSIRSKSSFNLFRRDAKLSICALIAVIRRSIRPLAVVIVERLLMRSAVRIPMKTLAEPANAS